MANFSIAEAKSRFAQLVHQAESGGPVRITRRGRAVAVLVSESLRIFRSCPLITPKRTRSSLQMLAIARAMAVLCA